MPIDLRSDTVTQPTPAMREAMYRAEVGDDVYDEDPTVHRLQDLAAERTGKEAALFVPTGTMGNTISMLTHAGRGQAVVVGSESHIYQYEAGAASTLGGLPLRIVANHTDGSLDMAQLEANITDESNPHFAPTALICIENTHNRCGGTVQTVAQVQAVADLAHSRSLVVHMDGARIFNAAIALDVPVSTLVEPVDSLMFCLSKGLSAPVGSLIVGKREWIRRAHRMRKLMGGGMRQVGVLAAAGIVALEQMVERMADDHQYCKQLALGLAEVPGIIIDPEQVVTNILTFRLHHPQQQRLFSEAENQQFLLQLREHGVLMGPMGGGIIRAVTHYGIERGDIDTALSAVQQTLHALI